MPSQNEHLNIGSMVTDPNYPDDGVGMMIVDIDLTGRHHHFHACRDEIYRIHSFVTGHGVWLDRDYVERECILIYSSGKNS